MLDPIEEAIIDLIDTILESKGQYIDSFGLENYPWTVSDFQNFLEQRGLMIVPIEDPTNLWKGVEE